MLVAGRVGARARVGGEHQLDAGRVLGGAAGPGQHHPPALQRLAQRLQRRRRRSPAPRRGTAPRGGRATARRAGPARCRRRPGRPGWRCGAGPGTAGGGSAGRPAGARPAIDCSAVTSSAASSSSSGRIDGSRSASIVLPAPGGPNRARWWPPAAATSRPYRPSSWPATSARSGPVGRRRPASGGGGSSSGPAPRTKSTSRCSESTARTVTPGTTVASRALASGTITRVIPARAAAATIGSTPRTGRTVPSRPSSPRTTTPSSGRGRQLAGAGEQRGGDGEVEAAAVFRQGGGQQVDGDPAVGPGLAGVDHRGPDPVAGLVQRGVRQAGEHHGGQAGGEVGLDLDQVAGHPDQADAEDAGVAHGSERRADVLDPGGAARLGQHLDHVEADLRGVDAGARPASGGRAAAAGGPCAGRPPRPGVPKRSPRRVFTSQKTMSSPSRRIEVDLAVGAAPVAVEHHQALILQVPCGEPLAVRADRPSLPSSWRRRVGADRGRPRDAACGRSATVDNPWVIDRVCYAPCCGIDGRRSPTVRIVEGHRYADDRAELVLRAGPVRPGSAGAYDSGIDERPSGAFRLPERRDNLTRCLDRQSRPPAVSNPLTRRPAATVAAPSTRRVRSAGATSRRAAGHTRPPVRSRSPPTTSRPASCRRSSRPAGAGGERLSDPPPGRPPSWWRSSWSS